MWNGRSGLHTLEPRTLRVVLRLYNGNIFAITLITLGLPVLKVRDGVSRVSVSVRLRGSMVAVLNCIGRCAFPLFTTSAAT